MMSSPPASVRRLGHLDVAQRVVRQHVLLQPVARLVRLLPPAGRAGRHHLDQREARPVDLVLERLPDRLLRVHDGLRLVHRDARQVGRRAQRREQLDDADRDSRPATRRGPSGRSSQPGPGSVVGAIWPPVMP